MVHSLRKVQDVWDAIDDKRVKAGLKSREWKQSYEGIVAALKHVGLIMVTTKEEFASLPVPTGRNGASRYYMERKVIVTRDGIESQATSIGHLMSGGSGLLTDVERERINEERSAAMKIARPKGSAHSNNVESNAINALNDAIGIGRELCGKHLLENRLGDIAYCLSSADQELDVFVPDQVKSSRAATNGRVTFHAQHGVLTVKHIIDILEKGMSLTLIGSTYQGQLDVIWLFHGEEAIKGLNDFAASQGFSPRLHLKIAAEAASPFNQFINQKKYRFEIGDTETERNRLLLRRTEIVNNGKKHTLTYLNEDESQIPSLSHQAEHKAFNLTRNACAVNLIHVYRNPNDAYGCVDFRVQLLNSEALIQDKVASRKGCCMRKINKHPYNPDSFDIFQITDCRTKIVYAIPMRAIRDGCSESYFTAQQLMKTNITFSQKWKDDFKEFQYDLNSPSGVVAYVATCQRASQVPKLTDQNFYTDLLNQNADMFVSPRKKT